MYWFGSLLGEDVAWMGDELRYLERLLAARPGQLRRKARFVHLQGSPSETKNNTPERSLPTYLTILDLLVRVKFKQWKLNEIDINAGCCCFLCQLDFAAWGSGCWSETEVWCYWLWPWHSKSQGRYSIRGWITASRRDAVSVLAASRHLSLSQERPLQSWRRSSIPFCRGT